MYKSFVDLTVFMFCLQETEAVAMLTSIVHEGPSMKGEENQKSYQIAMEHIMVCHASSKVDSDKMTPY